jgi:hypothetical protein
VVTGFLISAGSGEGAWDGFWQPLPGVILPADQYYVAINSGVCCWTTRPFWNSLDTISILENEWECGSEECVGPPHSVPPPINLAASCTNGVALASWEGSGRESHFQVYLDHVFLDNVSGENWEFSFTAAPGWHTFCVTAWNWSGGSPPACVTFDCGGGTNQLIIPDNLANKVVTLAVSPNPFNPTTRIEFELTEAQHVQLNIFDIQGRVVETLVNEQLASGTHSHLWDAAQMPSGIYWAQLVAGSDIRIEKLLLMK